MNSLNEQETLIGSSINIFQQDDINSFPVLPSQTTPKTPTSPAKGKRTTTISLARPLRPFADFELLTYFTRRQAVTRHSCDLPLQVCQSGLEKVE
ncbi:hypothetical protein QQF64_022568 [Cirrhinus molitorella]|uniref:Uncharacterized protein n=1 Tax=Cirrhinus molitorella TaxID=172907 RepID=A0ABR3L2Z8_9TELE